MSSDQNNTQNGDDNNEGPLYPLNELSKGREREIDRIIHQHYSVESDGLYFRTGGEYKGVMRASIIINNIQQRFGGYQSSVSEAVIKEFMEYANHGPLTYEGQGLDKKPKLIMDDNALSALEFEKRASGLVHIAITPPKGAKVKLLYPIEACDKKSSVGKGLLEGYTMFCEYGHPFRPHDIKLHGKWLPCKLEFEVGELSREGNLFYVEHTHTECPINMGEKIKFCTGKIKQERFITSDWSLAFSPSAEQLR